MDSGTVYLLLSLGGAAATLASATAGRRPPALGPLYFLVALPVAETPLHHVALSALVTAGFAACGAFGQWQGWLGLALLVSSWILLWVVYARSRRAAPVVERALEESLGPNDAGSTGDRAPRGGWLRPLRLHDRDHVERLRDLSYGPAGRRNRLDVYRPRGGASGAPVLLQIHGGAWVFGTKDHQGLPLMNELARRGWVCVAPNYRLSPKATFPDHLVDCKLALKWIRENIAAHGGDPAFVAVTGGSAGGHLASLLALTPNEPEYQPGFEQLDTSVQAAVPFYGAYDFLHHNGVDIERIERPGFVEKQVMKSSPRSARREWERASPIRWVRPDAPPFFVIHGSHDSLVWAEGARSFVAALRRASRAPVAYAEIPGAQHAFDLLASPRCLDVVDGVARFLDRVRARA